MRERVKYRGLELGLGLGLGNAVNLMPMSPAKTVETADAINKMEDFMSEFDAQVGLGSGVRVKG